MSFKTLAEVTAAVDAGHTVCWENDGYTVGPDLFGKYHVTWRAGSRNPHTVSLFHADGIGSDYSPEDFYIKG